MSASSISEEFKKIEDQGKKMEAAMLHGILASVSRPMRKYPLNEFVRWWLPFFTGDVKYTDEAVLQMENTWMRIAASRTDGVTLVDQNGREVIDVPPLLSNEVLPVNLDRISESLDAHQNTILNVSTMGGYSQQRAVNDAMTMSSIFKVEDVDVNPVKQKHAKAWSDFLDNVIKLTGYQRRVQTPTPNDTKQTVVKKPAIEEDDGMGL